MKEFKETLIKEMDERVPAMSEHLKNYPITVSETKSHFVIKWQVFTPIITIVLLALVILPFLFIDQEHYVYMLEVNPTILISTDAKNKVTDIKSGNQDADKVLVSLNIEDLIGQSLTDVGEIIADELLQLGYFDANDINAMKVSSTNEKSEFATKLTDYFCEKGYFVAVLSAELNLDEFNLQFQTKVNTIKDIYQYVHNLDDYYVVNQDYENVDIQEMYKTTYLETYLKDTLEKEIANVIQVNECLLTIKETYTEILTHDAIPFYARDYWAAREYYEKNPTELTTEVSMLLDKMQNSLALYANLTGETIESYTKILDIYAMIMAMPIEELLEIMNNLHTYISSAEYDANIDLLISYITLVLPHVSELLTELKELPKTKDTLVEKIKTMCVETNQVMKKFYLKEYQSFKESITDNEYQKRLDEIISEYGSLKNFWENIKNIQ